MSGDLGADFAGMDSDRSVLAGISGELTGASMPSRRYADDAAAAAGEFEGEIAAGAATFALSWWSVLSFFGECADLLADNLGNAVVVLTDVDTSLGTTTGTVPAPGAPG